MNDREFEEYRMGHLTRTAEVWKSLMENGVSETTNIDFDFQILATSKENAKSLTSDLPDYDFTTKTEGFFKKRYLLSSNSGPITWTEEQLLKWIDYLILMADKHSCTFEACGASVPEEI